MTDANVVREVTSEAFGSAYRILKVDGDADFVLDGGRRVPICYHVEVAPIFEDGTLDEWGLVGAGMGPDGVFATLDGANGFLDAVLALPEDDSAEARFWDLLEEWEGR